MCYVFPTCGAQAKPGPWKPSNKINSRKWHGRQSTRKIHLSADGRSLPEPMSGDYCSV